MSGKWDGEDDGGSDMEYDYDDDGSYEYESDESDGAGEYEMKVSRPATDTFTVYDREEIKARQAQVAGELADVLALPLTACKTILRHYRWNAQAVKTRWFDGDEEPIRAKAGVSECSEEPMTPLEKSEVFCDACMSDVPASTMRYLNCGHGFCTSCWQEHLSLAVEGGVSSVFTRCMDDCHEAVPDEWFAELLPKKLADKYAEFVIFSFVEHNRFCRWCSNPGCKLAIEYPTGGMRDITCRCGHMFCFACGQEPHRPATCEMVQSWQEKNSAESENVTWIIANTKKCPKCRKPIEKNQGCNHMTCRTAAGGCGHEFCWLCLGPWSEHGSATGGYYRCNRYEEDKAAGKTHKQDTTRAKAKSELDFYIHHFDRFINHDRARKIAIRQLPELQEAQETLQTKCGYKLSDVTFIRDAADQVIKCRQVLKWTYVYGFFLKNQTERNLFEHLQEQLEKHTEHLHGLVETKMTDYWNPRKDPKRPFFSHRSDVTNFTAITKKFLAGLLSGVEGGLTEAGRAAAVGAS